MQKHIVHKTNAIFLVGKIYIYTNILYLYAIPIYIGIIYMCVYMINFDKSYF